MANWGQSWSRRLLRFTSGLPTRPPAPPLPAQAPGYSLHARARCPLGSAQRRSGYDLVLECNGVLRHVQFKSSHRDASTRDVTVHVNFANKPSGCVIWIVFDTDTLKLGPFLWFGGSPGQPLPPLGDRVARHAKGDSTGRKSPRPNLRVVGRNQFKELSNIDRVAIELFGVPR